MATSSPPIPTVKAELRKLILHALELQYTSQSSVDRQLTGNHYQSVRLGDERTRGFRTDRREFLERLAFRGKSVLDLGSNLGEMSRLVRELGADWVDGYEYDPYFVEIARLVNVYNDTTRVCFYEADVSRAQSYGREYDIVLAFSVWVYIIGVMDQVAAATRQALVFETHKLENNLQVYIDLIGRHFPFHEVLGYSEWATSLDKKEKRAIVVFARTANDLDSMLVRETSR